MGRRTSMVAVGLLAASLGGTACIGATPRPAFEDELRSRSGGLVDELALDAVEVVEGVVGPGLTVRGLSIQPLNAQVVLDAVVSSDGATDRFVVRSGEVLRVDPVQLSASAQDQPAVPAVDLPLQRVEEMGDGARAALGLDGSWIESVTFSLRDGEVRVSFRVESDRAYGTAVFDGDAQLVEAERG